MRSLLSAAVTAALAVVVFAGSAAADDWGTVKGRVTWGGKSAYKPEKIEVTKDQEHCLGKGDLFREEFVVGKNGGVKDVFVWLQDASDPTAKLPIHPSLKKPKTKEVVMDQPCCKFVPHAIALREGQVLIGKNSSPIAHNMHWLGGDDNPGDNKLIPAGGQIEITLNASRSPVEVKCDIHGWMKGWVRVFNHPYFALTDADGKFEIKNAPAGKYNIVMWQEGVGWVNGGKKGQPIEIPADKTVEVDEKLKPEDK
ncbi:MAG TPA: hypothetical protein VKA46_21250 [Gemmataceae bacterium]|nr:hypothetical protein [Gemmataceae bacterium]